MVVECSPVSVLRADGLGFCYPKRCGTTSNSNISGRWQTHSNKSPLSRSSVRPKNTRSITRSKTQIRDRSPFGFGSGLGSYNRKRSYPCRIRIPAQRGGGRSVTWTPEIRAPRCPKCDEPVAHGETHCWYCGVNLQTDLPDKPCSSCGTPARIARAIALYKRSLGQK